MVVEKKHRRAILSKQPNANAEVHAVGVMKKEKEIL
jgi:hypothetical protein